MPRTITYTSGILRGGPDASLTGGQRRPRESEEPDREHEQRERDRDDHDLVEHAAAALGLALGAHRARPARPVLVDLPARELRVQAVEPAQDLADHGPP